MDTHITTGGSDLPPSLPSRYAPIIERAPLPMVEVEGRSHTVCFVNSAFCRLLHRRREELLGRPFADIVSNGAKCIELLDRVYETGECETHAEPDEANSTPAYWLYAMWPALDAKERPERVIIQVTKATQFRQNAAAMNEELLLGALRQHELRVAAEKSNVSLQMEIAERRRIEADLDAAHAQLRANAEKLEQAVIERTAQLRASMVEMEAFAYSLAHDLRAPVRAIHSFTQLVLEMPRDEIGPSAGELLSRVVKAAIRMDSLIQDVLDLSHIIRRPIMLAAVDVNTLVRALIDERPELSPSRAEIKIESPLLSVLAHEAMLSQCLTNLLSNAIKFVEPGVMPRVRIWTEELHGLPAAGSPDATPPALKSPARPRVRLWIEDQGIGIAAGAHERIFEIFQRLHSSAFYEGSGIGLAIVRKAIERMGGRVGVESGVRQGSRFWLELPKA
jgi:signal transduction histidine kinase